MARKTGPSKEQADLVSARSAGVCEAIFIDECTGRAEQMHHRRARGMGGSRKQDTNSPANLLHICLPCHNAIESFRSLARAQGFLVSQHCAEPVSHVAVWRRGELVLLTDFGGVVPQEVPF
ncbi:hypothetical protein ACRAJ3_25160 [Rhodococcus pyridinivorans]|uniref:hypothetical protein n=1 Tax=Rhodococcus pyridinivorans TaxID=103816 RepID=UPI003D7F5044